MTITMNSTFALSLWLDNVIVSNREHASSDVFELRVALSVRAQTAVDEKKRESRAVPKVMLWISSVDQVEMKTTRNLLHESKWRAKIKLELEWCDG